MSLHSSPCLFNTKQLWLRINSKNLTYSKYGCEQIHYKTQVCDVMHGRQEGGISQASAPPSGLKTIKIDKEGKVPDIKIIKKIFFCHNCSRVISKKSLKWLQHKSIRKFSGYSILKTSWWCPWCYIYTNPHEFKAIPTFSLTIIFVSQYKSSVNHRCHKF